MERGGIFKIGVMSNERVLSDVSKSGIRVGVMNIENYKYNTMKLYKGIQCKEGAE